MAYLTIICWKLSEIWAPTGDFDETQHPIANATDANVRSRDPNADVVREPRSVTGRPVDHVLSVALGMPGAPPSRPQTNGLLSLSNIEGEHERHAVNLEARLTECCGPQEPTRPWVEL